MENLDILNQHGAELKRILYLMMCHRYELPIIGEDPVKEGKAEFIREDVTDDLIMMDYEEGDWECFWEIIGDNPRSEFLIVFYKAAACFTMGLDIRVIDPQENSTFVDALLKSALSASGPSLAWHRTHKFYTNDYDSGYYVNRWLGDISSFSGEEKIILCANNGEDAPRAVYVANYHGQVVGNEAKCYNRPMSQVTLRKISRNDGEKERAFLLTFPLEENGFERPGKRYDLESPEGFAEFVEAKLKQERGEDLPEGYVPDTMFWILSDGKLAGVAKVRHFLTDALREHGGHIGLGIAEEYRGQGVGTEALIQLVNFTKGLSEEKVLVTIQEHNTASRMMTEHAGGKLEKLVNGRAYYWL